MVPSCFARGSIGSIYFVQKEEDKWSNEKQQRAWGNILYFHLLCSLSLLSLSLWFFDVVMLILWWIWHTLSLSISESQLQPYIA